MVIHYMIECISSASLKISSKVFELIYFTVLISYLLVRLLAVGSKTKGMVLEKLPVPHTIKFSFEIRHTMQLMMGSN